MKWHNPTLFGVAVGLLVVSGVGHGLWTDRWKPSPEVAEFAARLAQVPSDIGDWHGTDMTLTDQELRAARIQGYVYRRYENTRNRHAVTMLLVCGRAGPIAVHTPDVCFEGAGYVPAMKHVPMEIPYGSADESAGLRTMRFTKTQAAFPTEVRVFWGWSDGGAWKGPEQPRLTFAGRRALYKLYVLREKAPDDTRVEDDPCVLFMKELLPELDASLRVPR